MKMVKRVVKKKRKTGRRKIDDYRTYLEEAARQMILIHKVDTLIRLILRRIVRTLNVEHAGIFLYDKRKDEYVVKVSQGEAGARIPAGFVKVSKANPIIRYFTGQKFSFFDRRYLLYRRINYYLRNRKYQHNKKIISFLKELKEECTVYHAKAFIPGFFRQNLIGVLFLGAKEDKSDFTLAELGFLSILASDVVMAIQNAWLFEDLRNQLEANKRMFLNTVTALAAAIETKDKYTIGHTERVVAYSLAIAEEIEKGMPQGGEVEFRENVRIAALLHDIGKIGVPERVLNKKKPLNDRDWAYIKKHPLMGEGILSSLSEFKDAIAGVKYHHERYDGKGYPYQLKGDEIPLVAAIISVADAFDAMTTDRPYRRALTLEEAIGEIKRNRGKQFSPLVVDAFLRAYKKNLIKTDLSRS